MGATLRSDLWESAARSRRNAETTLGLIEPNPMARAVLGVWRPEMPVPAHHERLSALDAMFLGVEDRCTHMHIGSVGVFELGPAARPDGGLDLDRMRRLVSVVLDGVPRYRQRVERTPAFDHPVWVDDASFNLDYHLRHTRLPLPGDERQLKRLAGRLMSQQLDRGKPLWETWLVEGLEGHRFAVVSKVHHCMVDGVGGVEMSMATMRTEPGADPRLAGAPRPFLPRPVPAGRDLMLGEIKHRLGGALGFVSAAVGSLGSPRRAVQTVRGTIEGLVESFVMNVRPSSPTPFNVEIGPHRRFDWLSMDLATVKAVKARLGGTVNDVVLAVVTGAMRGFLAGRGVHVDQLDFRAMVPVNLRGGSTGAGNYSASMVARLPVDEPDPRRRLERVRAETEVVKHSHQIETTRAIEQITDWTFTTLMSQTTRLAALSQPFNLIVTNVPGPQFPLYFLGARLLECYPLVPLFQHQALGVALFSYDGQLFWGFNADWDSLPDLHALLEGVAAEFRLLAAEAGVDSIGEPMTGTVPSG